MEPTFQDKDIIIVEKVSQLLGKLEKEDIVIVKTDKIDHQDKKIIKRVIGFEGDKIEIKNGVLYLNGKEKKEPYIKEEILGDYPEITVPKGKVFVMGDNRNNSSDSRAFGAFGIEDLEGKVFIEIKNDFLKFPK